MRMPVQKRWFLTGFEPQRTDFGKSFHQRIAHFMNLLPRRSAGRLKAPPRLLAKDDEKA
jgi:hypothetical protein